MTLAPAATMRSKARLTITMAPELLERLDRRIDGVTLRNRSQAIETLLEQVLTPTVTTAVILTGGVLGTTAEVPALAPIAGRALISRTIQHLTNFGIRRVFVLAGGNQRGIQALMGGGEGLGVSIEYLVEKKPRGTAGALKLVEPHLDSEPFLVIHGDVLTDIDLDDFIGFHFSEEAVATIAVKPRAAERRYGQVMLQGNRITEFLETSSTAGFTIVNTGVYLFQPGIFDFIDGDGPAQFETDVFPVLARRGELSAFLFQGIWYDISTPTDYRRADRRWRNRGG
ncbi:MAG: sugar phosphate nucleotidyltransferase [Acidobacteriota bacterium]|nr:sugar phosphate nucleotidyltransferase [Acidobacteriota bacterium]